MRLLLSFKPFREHLGINSWNAILNLSSEILGFEAIRMGEDDLEPSRVRKGSFNTSEMIEMARILSYLAVSCPKDLVDRGEHLLTSLCSCIRIFPTDNPCIPYFLESINHIIWECLPMHLDYILIHLSQMVPILLPLYDSKITSTKFHLIYIFRTYIELFRRVDPFQAPDFIMNMSNIFEKLQKDIVSRTGGFGYFMTVEPLVGFLCLAKGPCFPLELLQENSPYRLGPQRRIYPPWSS